MKNIYVKFDDNIEEILKENIKKNTIIVTNDTSLLKKQFKYCKVMSYNELFFDFKLIDKIVLREEKKLFFFYNTINSKIKEFFGIKSYFDVIDIYPEFEKFIKIIKKNKLKKEKVLFYLSESKKKIADVYFQIDELLKDKIKDTEYIFDYMLIDSNLNNVFKEYEYIFINPFLNRYEYLEIINVIEKDKIINILKIDKNKYDEKNVEILENDIQNILKDKNIKLIECSKNIDSLIYTLLNINDRNYKIYDKKLDNNLIDYEYELFNRCGIEYMYKKYIKKTSVYIVLKDLYEIISSVEDNMFDVKKMYKSMINVNFRKFFKIDDNIFSIINELNNNGYIFFDENMELINKNDKFVEFLNYIREIIRYNSIKSYSEIIENLSNFNILEDNHYDYGTSILETITELETLENFDFIKELNYYFGEKNLSSNILKFILKYLELKPIKTKSLETDIKIFPFNQLKTNSLDDLFLLNLSGDLYSKIDSLFNASDLEKLGIFDDKYNKLAFEYNLIESIYNSKNCYITFYKDYENSKLESSFVILLKFLLNKNYDKFTVSDDKLDKLFKYEYEINYIKKDLEKKYLTCTKEDYRPKSMGIYDMKKLLDSDYLVYVKSILNKNKISIRQEISTNIIIGQVLNDLYQITIENFITDIRNGSIDDIKLEEFILSTLKKLFLKYKYLLKKVQINILENVYVDKILYVLKKIINRLSKNVEYKNLEVFSEYELKYNKNLEMDIKGRADLLFKKNEKVEIFDIKKNIKDKKAMNEYSLQLLLYYLMYNEKIMENFIEKGEFSINENIRLGLIGAVYQGIIDLEINNENLVSLQKILDKFLNYSKKEMEIYSFENSNSYYFTELEQYIYNWSEK